MTTQSSTLYRYELLHEDDADFVAYQSGSGGGDWQTVSWMIPRA